LRDRFARYFRAHRAPLRAIAAGTVIALFVAGFIVVATSSRNPDLSHVKAAFLSGSEDGNYHAVVERVAAEVRRRGGRIENVPSPGSVSNIERLVGERRACRAQFALVQEGLKWPEGHSLQLIARLPVPESLVILGRKADAVKTMTDLRGMRVGIGPVGSGTAQVAQEVMALLAELDVKASTHTFQEQLDLATRGDLDLAAFVIEPDARLVVDAVRGRGLQLVDMAGADAIAHRLPSARAGVIKAGYYDPVRQLPPTDKRVLNVDTLVVGNGCARASATQGLITALTRVYPNLVRVNREEPNLTGLQYAPAAQGYFDDQGPDTVGEHVPWVIDIMSTARWLQLIFAFSLLFGAQALWHRFRLWRIDARRVAIENDIEPVLGHIVSVAEIGELAPTAAHAAPESRARIDAAIADLEKLARRCRRQSLSMLVPMGQEMSYRYQERLIADLLHVLRRFRAKLA
jgi:TRAP-type uncharacterized transport system substrate-binding protein